VLYCLTKARNAKTLNTKTCKIVSFGDSFIYGTQLKDEGHSWVATCAKKLGVDYQTFAQAGCGNESITRQILKYFSVPRDSNTLAVINWTWGIRYDFYLSGAEHWIPLCHENNQIELEKRLSKEEAEKISNFYTNYAGKSILWDRWRSLQTIFSAQQFLKIHNIKNVQTYMDYMLLDTEWHCPDYIKTLQDLTKPQLKLFEGKNFVDWSNANGYLVTSDYNHPLEDAHEAASKLWLNTYRGVLEND